MWYCQKIFASSVGESIPTIVVVRGTDVLLDRLYHDGFPDSVNLRVRRL